MEEMPSVEDLPLSSSPGKLRKQNTVAVVQNEHIDGTSFADDDKDDAFSMTNSKSTHQMSEVLSQTLPSAYKYSTMSPSRNRNPEKRKSLGMFRRSKDEDQLQEPEPRPMEISGPEQKQFDWRKRKVRGVRTTLRRNRKSTPSQADIIPELSYSFEVS